MVVCKDCSVILFILALSPIARDSANSGTKSPANDESGDIG